MQSLMANYRGWAGAALALALVWAPCALAGLIIENDQSDLCNSNLQDCTSRCAPPQSFIFSCNSGGTFSKPQSDCKCTNPPSPDVITDGSAIMQLVQWPGPQACAGQTWMYDCAQFINVQAVMNNIQATATDQASAMAAVAAAQAAAQAAAAQAAAAQAAAEMAAKAQAQADPSGLNAPPAAPGTSFGPAPVDPLAAGAGMGGAGMGGAGMGGAGMGGAGMGGAGMAAPMTGAGMGGGMGAGMGSGFGAPTPGFGGVAPMPGTGAGIMSGGGAGPMGGGFGGAPTDAAPITPGLPGNSLMNGQFGRHLLQGGVLGAAAMPVSSGAMPSTTLSPACSKLIQGLVTGANTGLLAVPNAKGVANMLTRGNDTMFVQLGGASSNCVAAYKLMTGQIMNLGRPAPGSSAAPAPAAAAKSAAGTIAIPSVLSLLLGLMLALVL